jgi:hypothetical protein
MKLPSFSSMFAVYRQGGSVADAALHHNVSALGVALGGLLFTLAGMAQTYGIDLSFITPEVAASLGAFIAGLFGMHWRYATSPDRGLPGLKPVVADAPVAGSPGDGTARGLAPAPSPVGGGPAVAREPDPVRTIAHADGPLGDFMP